jgi:S1-C subfamily serine protease
VRPALELAAAVQPGDSGAPVTDASGRVLGIVFARSDSGPPTAWAVDAAAAGALLTARR